MLTLIWKWLGIARLEATLRYLIEEKAENFYQLVRELRASSTPYVIITGSIQIGGKGFPYSVGMQPERFLGDLAFRHNPQGSFVLDKVELFGAGYQIEDVLLGHVSYLSGIIPSGTPFVLPGNADDKKLSPGSAISVRVSRQKDV